MGWGFGPLDFEAQRFAISLCDFPYEISLALRPLPFFDLPFSFSDLLLVLCVFPSFSKNVGGSAQRKTFAFFGVSLFQKKGKGWRVRDGICVKSYDLQSAKLIDLLIGLFGGAVFRHGGGARKQPMKQPTEMPTSTMALMGSFPYLMGRFPTFMGRFPDFVLRGRFAS